jgi:hypothetical protein
MNRRQGQGGAADAKVPAAIALGGRQKVRWLQRDRNTDS